MMQASLAELIDIELSKPWNQVRNSKLNALYEDWRNVGHLAHARLALWGAGFIYMSFSMMDVIMVPDMGGILLASRLVTTILGIGILERRILKESSAKNFDLWCGNVGIVALLVWLIPTSLSSYQSESAYYSVFGIVFMMVFNLFFNLNFVTSVIISSITLIIYFLFLFNAFYVGYIYKFSMVCLYISTYVLTLFVNWKFNSERYRVFLNSTRATIRQNEVAERSAALLRLSVTDALTGLANRRCTDESLQAYWRDWQSHGRGFAVILVDIDYFKPFNDHAGHQAGDRCLVSVAKALGDTAARHDGMAGRFGGEEFMVLIPTATRDEVAIVAEEIRRCVQDLSLDHASRPDGYRFVTVSVGAAFSPDHAQASGVAQPNKVEKLVSEADRALYAAKADGRNRIRVFDRTDPEQIDAMRTIAALLQSAVAEGLLSLVYQPIRNARTGRIEAVETLMRLRREDGTPVSPGDFIPVAERTGAIIELGVWAIRTVCRDILAADLAPVASVNVSVVQLRRGDFAETVAAILAETGIAPGRLAFEVTEGMSFECDSAVLASLAALRRLGAKIWLDDFGTGFAGLSALRAVEFDTVKIDRSFLHAADTPRGAALFKDIVALVRNAGPSTIVEGVETDEQVEFLAHARIDRSQGFHLGRPMTADALTALIGMETEAMAAVSA